MKKVYDMGSGQLIENSSPATSELAPTFTDTRLLPELRFQEVLQISCEEMRIPPQLSIADLSAFFDEMV